MSKLRSFIRARSAGEVVILGAVIAVTVIAVGAKLGEAISNFAAAA